MDPLSIGGLTVGVVSLTFQVFSGCVIGYQLLHDAKGMPSRYQHLRLRLHMEQLKLIDWAMTANLSESDETMGLSVRSNRHTINDILHQIETLLLDASTLSMRYGLKLAVDEEKSGDHSANRISSLPQIAHTDDSKLLKKALEFVAKSRRYPTRLRWAVFDNKRFEELLLQLARMSDSMTYFLETDQKRLLLQTQQNTFLQVLQISNKMDDLFELLSSLNISSRATKIEIRQTDNLSQRDCENEPDIAARITHDKKLLRLAQFKALAIAVESEVTYTGSLIPVPANSRRFPLELGLLKLEDSRVQIVSHARSAARYGTASVWVEWRYYTSLAIDTGPPEYMNERISKLALLLTHEMSPPEFRIPKCHGYILQPEYQRFGFVFENSGPRKDAIPASLHALLADYELPCLTTRVEMALAIANSVWYLHATNWLHKGLRSDNIVFLDTVDLTAPSLCGFEYARPMKAGELTEKPSNDPFHDLYRHPNAQFELPTESEREFKKIYDIYSLGIILLEIGMWKDIGSILENVFQSRIDKPTIRRTQFVLLNGEYLTKLEAQAGRTYAVATRTCISGDFSIDFNTPDEETGAQLQLEFGDKVIKLLASISV